MRCPPIPCLTAREGTRTPRSEVRQVLKNCYPAKKLPLVGCICSGRGSSSAAEAGCSRDLHWGATQDLEVATSTYEMVPRSFCRSVVGSPASAPPEGARPAGFGLLVSGSSSAILA